MNEDRTTALSVPPEVIGESIIPYVPDDSRKHYYLSLRASGLAVKEAREMADIASQTLKNWRHTDLNFRYWDGPGLLTLRKQYRDQLLLEEWARNFRLVLEDQSRLLSTPLAKLSEDERKARTKLWREYGPDKLKVFKEVAMGNQERRKDIYDLIKALDTAKAVEGDFEEVDNG